MSLLEILISIGIVAVGLLGLATLLPLAGKQATQGLREDRAAAMGRRAYREFMIAGYANRDLYWTIDGAVDLLDNNRRMPVLIDPIQCGVYSANNGDTTNMRAKVMFPAKSLADTVAMYSVTFRPRPGGSGIMKLPHALQVCSSHDELSVDPLDADHSKAAVQAVAKDGATVLKRYDELDFTWFATVTDITDRRALLSIVVVYKRDLSFAINSSTGDQRVAQVRYPYSDAIAASGGEVFVFGSSAEQLEVKPGWWVMLCSDANSQLNYRWYRVANATEVKSGTGGLSYFPATAPSGTFYRSLTLQGADFPRGTNDRCFLVRGAMAVYEKTIRIEKGSLFGVQ